MKTILVVDDSVANRQPMARLLRSQGYETLCVGNGMEAVETFHFTTPDLILLDLMMPVMDGLGLLKKMQHHPVWANLPVIVVTAKPSDDVALQHARQLGAKECFVKADFTLDQLFTSIRRHIAC